MEYAKTPRHNKVRHNVIAPMPEDVVKKRIVPPFAQWIDESNSKSGNKWIGEETTHEKSKLSRKNALPHLTSPTKDKHNNVSVNNISITESSIVSEKDGVQIVEEEEIVKNDFILPGNLNGELNLREIEEGREINDASSVSSKKTFSQHSLISTDVETSSVDTYRGITTNNNTLLGHVGVGLAMGIGGIRPNIEMLQYSNNNTLTYNNNLQYSGNLETFERLAEASGHRKGSILKNSSTYDFFATPKSNHGSARLIREDERRVSWSDLHHGKELTQVREVDYGESKFHRIMRQNRRSVIITAALFVFCMVAIAVVVTVAVEVG